MKRAPSNYLTALDVIVACFAAIVALYFRFDVNLPLLSPLSRRVHANVASGRENLRKRQMRWQRPCGRTAPMRAMHGPGAGATTTYLQQRAAGVLLQERAARLLLPSVCIANCAFENRQMVKTDGHAATFL